MISKIFNSGAFFRYQNMFIFALSLLNGLFAYCQGPSGGFLDGSVGKESACNAGDVEDMDSIPGLEGSLGGGK